MPSTPPKEVSYYECTHRLNMSKPFYYKLIGYDLFVFHDNTYVKAFYSSIVSAKCAGIIVDEVSEKYLLLRGVSL